ncbi:MAG: hypothetical protein HRT91_00780 [Piscirickettsiaceae bacterium]|nr:hypothetical protein [Piscirickettsiaceae bacterium]
MTTHIDFNLSIQSVMAAGNNVLLSTITKVVGIRTHPKNGLINLMVVKHLSLIVFQLQY